MSFDYQYLDNNQKVFYIHILVNVQLKEQMNRTTYNINVLTYFINVLA